MITPLLHFSVVSALNQSGSDEKAAGAALQRRHFSKFAGSRAAVAAHRVAGRELEGGAVVLGLQRWNELLPADELRDGGGELKSLVGVLGGGAVTQHSVADRHL